MNLAISSCLGRTIGDDNMLLDGGDKKRLMCCTGGGEVNRSSDPIIGAAAYAAATDPDKPKMFTLTDPIGLYIRSFEYSAMRPPEGFDEIITSDAVCTVERGVGIPDNIPEHAEHARILRLRIEAPPDAGYLLGDMRIGHQPIVRGGQLARLIDMQLFVDIWDSPGRAKRVPCLGTCCIGSDHILDMVGRDDSCGPGKDNAFPELRSAARPIEVMSEPRSSRRLLGPK